MTLQIDSERADKLKKLEGTAIDILQQYLDGDRLGGDDIVTARCVLNVIKGNRQTDTARQALQYSMVHDLDDKVGRERYVRATQPEIKKLMSGKKTG